MRFVLFCVRMVSGAWVKVAECVGLVHILVQLNSVYLLLALVTLKNKKGKI